MVKVPTMARVLTFIQGFVNDHGYAPSIREIQDGVGLSSSSSVNHHLKELAKRGKIRREDGKNRAITVVRDGCCPTCGK